MQLNRFDLNLLIALDARSDPGTVQRTFTLIVSADALLRAMPTVFRRLAQEEDRRSTTYFARIFAW